MAKHTSPITISNVALTQTLPCSKRLPEHICASGESLLGSGLFQKPRYGNVATVELTLL